MEQYVIFTPNYNGGGERRLGNCQWNKRRCTIFEFSIFVENIDRAYALYKCQLNCLLWLIYLIKMDKNLKYYKSPSPLSQAIDKIVEYVFSFFVPW